MSNRKSGLIFLIALCGLLGYWAYVRYYQNEEEFAWKHVLPFPSFAEQNAGSLSKITPPAENSSEMVAESVTIQAESEDVLDIEATSVADAPTVLQAEETDFDTEMASCQQHDAQSEETSELVQEGDLLVNAACPNNEASVSEAQEEKEPAFIDS